MMSYTDAQCLVLFIRMGTTEETASGGEASGWPNAVRRDRKCWDRKYLSASPQISDQTLGTSYNSFFFCLYTTTQTPGSSQISSGQCSHLKLSFDPSIAKFEWVLMDVWGGRRVGIADLVISRQKCKPRGRWKTATLRTTSTINPTHLINRHHHLNLRSRIFRI